MSLHPAVAAMGPNLSQGASASGALTITRINAIMDAIRALAGVDSVTAGPYLKTTTHNGKTVVSLGKPPARGGSAVAYKPFDARSINATDGVVLFRPGTVNGILPTNWSANVAFTKDVVNYVVLNCQAGQGQVTACALACQTDAPGPIGVAQGYPPSTFKVLTGLIVDNLWVRLIGPGSVTASSTEVVRTLKESPVAGEFPFNIVYTWNVLA